MPPISLSVGVVFGDQNYSIHSQEIVYIEVMRGKIWIYTDTDCFRWSGALNALEEMLPCPPFLSRPPQLSELTPSMVD